MARICIPDYEYKERVQRSGASSANSLITDMKH